jgi:hypothetical protein
MFSLIRAIPPFIAMKTRVSAPDAYCPCRDANAARIVADEAAGGLDT